MNFGFQQILAIVVSASFAAGLNVYATVATLGLLARFGLVPLPESLHLLTDTWVIAVAVVLFAVEFFADKVPAFDLLWNALQTFVRVPVAALLGYAAAAHLSRHQARGGPLFLHRPRDDAGARGRSHDARAVPDR